MRNYDSELLGKEVAAVAYVTFNEIGIYGFGEVIEDNDDEFTVKVTDIGNTPVVITCDSVVEMCDWCDFVNQTEAEVKRIPYEN